MKYFTRGCKSIFGKFAVRFNCSKWLSKESRVSPSISKRKWTHAEIVQDLRGRFWAVNCTNIRLSYERLFCYLFYYFLNADHHIVNLLCDVRCFVFKWCTFLTLFIYLFWYFMRGFSSFLKLTYWLICPSTLKFNMFMCSELKLQYSTFI